MAPNEYGIADAVNILFSVDALPDRPTCTQLADRLNAFQSPATGLFDEGSHHPYHCTAHCLAALELLNESPAHPLHAIDPYRDASAVAPLLSGLAWETCDASGHIGAGMFSMLYLSRTLTESWANAFFDWLTRRCDPVTGISIAGAVQSHRQPIWHYMGDWFHFLFCFHAMRRPFPHPERLVDSCIQMYDENQMPDSFGRGQRFLDIDWAFTLGRTAIQAGYRLSDSRARLAQFAARFVDYLAASPLSEPQWQDLHLMFGMVCALAELQCILPGVIRTPRALRQVLDFRPFI